MILPVDTQLQDLPPKGLTRYKLKDDTELCVQTENNSSHLQAPAFSLNLERSKIYVWLLWPGGKLGIKNRHPCLWPHNVMNCKCPQRQAASSNQQSTCHWGAPGTHYPPLIYILEKDPKSVQEAYLAWKHIVGWKDGSAVQSSSRGPAFSSQHPYGSSQPSIAPVQGISPLLTSTSTRHIWWWYICQSEATTEQQVVISEN